MIIGEIQYCSRCMRPHEADGVCPYCGYDAQNAQLLPHALEERTLLAKRYMLGAVIGAGGFGITYAAWDRALGVPVAVKEYFPKDMVTRNAEEDDEITLLPGDDNQTLFQLGLDRFEREAHVLAMLQSVPGIVTVQNWFRANGTAYIAMEYLHGETLGEYCLREKPDYDTLLKMLRQPIDALVICHRQGVLHRDISPNNLIVLEDGSVRLIDFGAAAQLSRQAAGKDRSVLLNRHYAPKEQYDENGNQGPWTDVYALCATIYAMLAGEPAPDAPARSANENLPALRRLHLAKDQRRILIKGMAVEPESRIQSMDELRSRLYHLPLPEEIIRRRRFVRRFCTITASAILIALIVILNFTSGLPLGAGLLYSLRPDGFHILDRTGTQEELVLPSSRMGIPVSSISPDAFSGDATLKQIVIPGSVSTIDALAFYACPALETVTLEEGVETVEASAFAACPSLHTFIVPVSLRSVDPTALKDASPLMFIWGSYDTEAHRLLSVRDGFPFAVRSEYEVEPNATGVTLLRYTDSLADQRPERWELVFPSYIDGLPITQMAAAKETDTGLEGGVFDLPSNAVSVTLPQLLREAQAFGASAADPASVPERTFALGNAIESIGPRAFSGIYLNARSVQLSEGLQRIEDFAFLSSSLVDIALPSTLTHIGKHAFTASPLRQITLPDSVTFVDEGAFSECVYLETAALSSGMTEIAPNLFILASMLKTADIPDGIERVGRGAFKFCMELEYLYLPDSVKTIESEAFALTSALRYIRIPMGASIAEDAFDGTNENLIIAGYPGSDAEALALKNGFRFEDVSRWNVFANPDKPGSILIDSAHGGSIVCASFDRANNRPITLVEGLHSVYIDTTPGVNRDVEQNLTSIELPVLAEEIGNRTFVGCVNLHEIELPQTLKTLGSAFSFSGLQRLSIPASLSVISPLAFSECSELDTVIFPADSSLQDLTDVFVTTGIKNISLPYSIRSLEGEFTECPRLSNVLIREGCLKINASFIDCGSLESIVIPASVQELRASFLRCENLRDVYFYGMDTAFEGVFKKRCFTGCPNVTIHGYPGSTAEAFALDKGIPFEPIADGPISLR